MSYEQRPLPGGRGFSRGGTPYPQYGQQIDPALVEALAQALAERGYAQDAARSQQEYGVFNDGTPNALQGGVLAEPNPLDWSGGFGSDLMARMQQVGRAVGPYDPTALQFDTQGMDAAAMDGVPYAESGYAPEGTDLLAQEAPLAAESMTGLTTPKKKKGEFSEFFKLLQKAKNEDPKGATRKALKDLAKQLEEPNAEGTIATS